MAQSAVFQYTPGKAETVQEKQVKYAGFFAEIHVNGSPIDAPQTPVSVTVDGLILDVGKPRSSFYVSQNVIYLNRFGFHSAHDALSSDYLVKFKPVLPKLLAALAEKLCPVPEKCIDAISGKPVALEDRRITAPFDFIDPVERMVDVEVKTPAQVYFDWAGPMPKDIVQGRSDGLTVLLGHVASGGARGPMQMAMSQYGYAAVPEGATEKQVREAFRDLASKLIDVKHPEGAEHWQVVEKITHQLV